MTERGPEDKGKRRGATEGGPEGGGERRDRTEGAGPGAGPADGTESGTDAAIERRLELVEHVDRLEDKLQRTRLTPWVWSVATLWFLMATLYTGNLPPGIFMSSICALLAASSFGIRRGRRRTLRDLRDQMEVASGERGPSDPPGRIADGDAQGIGPDQD